MHELCPAVVSLLPHPLHSWNFGLAVSYLRASERALSSQDKKLSEIQLWSAPHQQQVELDQAFKRERGGDLSSFYITTGKGEYLNIESSQFFNMGCSLRDSASQ